MNTAQDIRQLGQGFAARLDSTRLADALAHLDGEEWTLALELLAEKLRDSGVTLTGPECDRFDEIATRIGLSDDRFRFLRNQVA